LYGGIFILVGTLYLIRFNYISLATIKDVSTVAFEQKVAEAHRDQGLTPVASALMEAKKAAKVAQLAAVKARRAANEATFEADKERTRGISLPTDNSRHRRRPTIAPLSTCPLPVNHEIHPQHNNGKGKRGKNKTKHEKGEAIENPTRKKEKGSVNGAYGSQGITLVIPMNKHNGHFGPDLQAHSGEHQMPQGYPLYPAAQLPFPPPHTQNEQWPNQSHATRPQGQVFQNRVWTRPPSLNQNNFIRDGQQRHPQKHKRNRGRGKGRKAT
jgi:hypothetical protein